MVGTPGLDSDVDYRTLTVGPGPSNLRTGPSHAAPSSRRTVRCRSP